MLPGACKRSLGLLVRKVSDVRAEEMIRSLCDKVLSGKKEQQRDIASIGIKTIIAEIQGGPLATSLASTVTKKMLEGGNNKVQCAGRGAHACG